MFGSNGKQSSDDYPNVTIEDPSGRKTLKTPTNSNNTRLSVINDVESSLNRSQKEIKARSLFDINDESSPLLFVLTYYVKKII